MARACTLMFKCTVAPNGMPVYFPGAPQGKRLLHPFAEQQRVAMLASPAEFLHHTCL